MNHDQIPISLRQMNEMKLGRYSILARGHNYKFIGWIKIYGSDSPALFPLVSEKLI